MSGTRTVYLLITYVVWYLTVRPAPARLQAVKRPMPAGDVSTSMDVKRMRTASAVMPADVPASCASESSSVQNRNQNPVSVLNQYIPRLSYQLIGEYGPPHSKTFTFEVIVDEQVGITKYLWMCSVLYAHKFWFNLDKYSVQHYRTLSLKVLLLAHYFARYVPNVAKRSIWHQCKYIHRWQTCHLENFCSGSYDTIW